MTAVAAGPGRIEALLRKDREVAVATLVTVTALSWTLIVADAGMENPTPARWTPALGLAMGLMWWIMMIAMMLPSAAPAILLAAALRRKSRPERPPYGSTAGFAGGYLAAWTFFSVAATAAQWALDTAGLLTPAMRSSSSTLSGATLVAAGLWQLTPAKRACLRHCRSPAELLTRHRRNGRAGDFRMGVELGAYCLGCCGFLMALLFVGGVMDFAWIAGLTAYVLVEKLLPGGETLARLAGTGLAIWGAVLLIA